MDIVDQTQARDEKMGLTLTPKPEAPAATGHCLFCGEPVAPGLRWCDVACRDDWEFLDAQLRARGL
ncbi:hypothetical protein AGMMS50225_06810 [Betaproteobacteria bacterium]|nr:hypothetical protein AGMMS50225_06810 [Betaproteobacteria bacterium]